jgi:hypothetical protein
MEHRMEPRMELDTEQTLIQAIWYELRDVKNSVGRIEMNYDQQLIELKTRTNALEGRINELEKFRFAVQFLGGPLAGVRLRRAAAARQGEPGPLLAQGRVAGRLGQPARPRRDRRRDRRGPARRAGGVRGRPRRPDACLIASQPSVGASMSAPQPSQRGCGGQPRCPPPHHRRRRRSVYSALITFLGLRQREQTRRSLLNPVDALRADVACCAC